MSKTTSLFWIGGGVATVGAVFLAGRSNNPILQKISDAVTNLIPSKTGYHRVDEILDKLQAASNSSGVPLGLLVGWVAKESGGRIGEAPAPLTGEPDSERGYFQLTPSESKKLGLDHARLSTDPDYSIAGGVALVKDYANKASSQGVAPANSSYFWRLTKLNHTMGSGAVDKILAGAKAASSAGSWDALENHAVSNDAAYLASVKHSPKKWFPLVDEVYKIGQPFGFGNDVQLVAGTTVLGADFTDEEYEEMFRASKTMKQPTERLHIAGTVGIVELLRRNARKAGRQS